MSSCNDYVAILVSSVNVSRDATCGHVVVVISLLECASSAHSVPAHFNIVLHLSAAAKQQVNCGFGCTAVPKLHCKSIVWLGCLRALWVTAWLSGGEIDIRSSDSERGCSIYC